MKNVLLSVLTVTTLIAAGVGGTFASFVDTEISEDNFYQAGISDLLVNGKNDPLGPKIQYVHGAPCKSVDFWIDIFNWGECQGGSVYLHFKDVLSEEAGTKTHVDPATGLSAEWVYDAVSVYGMGIPDGYRIAVPPEPQGPGVWSSEPEKIAEVGDGYVAQIYIPPGDPCCMGEDYASGISDHLDVVVEVCDDGMDGVLDDADDDGDGTISPAQRAAHTWVQIPSLCGKLSDIACNKDLLGFLATQQYGWIHVDLHLQQIECVGWPDFQTRHWPTDALQGDRASWNMMFELIADP
jgi:hypothetical protein